MKRHGVARLVGVDLLPEAHDAAMRDRPGVYGAYYAADLCSLSDDERYEITSWSPDCLVAVSALGFGYIPAQAFLEAFNLISKQGWFACNIKETGAFFGRGDDSEFSSLTLIRELIFSKYIDLHHFQRYEHRLSLEGKPLYYFALSGKKNDDVPPSFIEGAGQSGSRFLHDEAS